MRYLHTQLRVTTIISALLITLVGWSTCWHDALIFGCKLGPLTLTVCVLAAFELQMHRVPAACCPVEQLLEHV